MGDEYMKQGYERDRRPFPGNDFCEPRKPEPPAELCCEPDPCGDDDWDWGSWLPILVLVFFLCGGTNIFGNLGFGGGRGDDCGDDFGGGWSWLIIIVVIFFLVGGNDRGGFGGFSGLGGLGGFGKFFG